MPFECNNVSPASKAVTIGSLNMLTGGQLLTVTALVRNVEPAKEVVKRATNEKITVTECQLTDPTGTIKLVLWKEFVKQVSNGDTCKFENVRLKTDNGKLSLSTTQAGCTIQNCIPFDNLQPPEELPSTIVTHDMSIFGITQLSSYNICCNCSKKIIVNQAKPVVKCQTCSIRVNKNKCPKQYYARVIVRNNDAKLNFTLFQQSLTEILDIYNKQNSEALDIAQI